MKKSNIKSRGLAMAFFAYFCYTKPTKMTPHTTYEIYPKAIYDFINDNYELNNINFGNIKNNVIAVLQKLKIVTMNSTNKTGAISQTKQKTLFLEYLSSTLRKD